MKSPWAIPNDPRITRSIEWPPDSDDHDQCGEFPCRECEDTDEEGGDE